MNKIKFTDQLWKAVLPVYEDILAHPFVDGLAKGTLPVACFRHYVAQDVLYLEQDAIILEHMAQSSQYPKAAVFFKEMSSAGVAIETTLLGVLCEKFDVVLDRKMSPAIKSYTSFLYDHARNSTLPVAAAAILPCFWIYGEVGNHIMKKNTENNPYKQWIDTYDSEEYDLYTDQFIAIVNELSEDISHKEKELMIQVFCESVRYELSFFEESWNQKR